MRYSFCRPRCVGGALLRALENIPVTLPAVASPLADEIVVTATRSPHSLDRVATTVRVIDAEQIRASSARNLSEVLRNLGPVQVRDSSGLGRDSRFGLRGFSSAQNVLVLVDGIEVSDPFAGEFEAGALQAEVAARRSERRRSCRHLVTHRLRGRFRRRGYDLRDFDRSHFVLRTIGGPIGKIRRNGVGLRLSEVKRGVHHTRIHALANARAQFS